MTSTELTSEPSDATSPDRMSAEERRAALIEVAFELLKEGGPESVTMGTVAKRSEVTRALVYKHFANRTDLLNATYRREAQKLDAAMSAEVRRAVGFEERLRTFVRTIFRAVDSHGWIFVPLRGQSLEPGIRAEQNSRDRRTVRNFASLASEEFGIPLGEAASALSILLTGVTALRLQARSNKEEKSRRELEDLYITVAMGALSAVRDRQRPAEGDG